LITQHTIWRKASKGLLVVIPLIVLLPYIVLTVFIQPNAEDFSLSFLPKYCNTGHYVFSLFINKDARLFTNFLYAINPLRYDLIWAYKLIPFFLMSGLTASLYLFLLSLIKPIRKNYFVFLLCLIFMSLFISTMPSPIHAFYWMASSLNYTVSLILLILIAFFALVLAYKANNNKPEGITTYLAVALLICCTVLSNEIYILSLLFLFLFLFFYALVKKQKAKTLYAVFFIVTSLASFVYLIPFLLFDNDSGAQLTMHQDGVLIALLLSVKSTFFNFFKWFFLIPALILFVFVVLLLLPRFKEHIYVLKNNFLWVNPLLVFGFIFMFCTFMLLPYYLYRNVDHEPQRIYNIHYFVFLLALVYLILYFFALYTHKIEHIINKQKALFGFLIILAFSVVLLFTPNTTTAYGDIISGKAFAFNKEVNKRFQLLKDAENENKESVILMPLSCRPKSIFFGPDIEPGIKNIWNQAYENYFNVSSISIGDAQQYDINNKKE